MSKMLLKSASTPILNSWVPRPTENDAVPFHLPRITSSLSFAPSSFSSNTNNTTTIKTTTRSSPCDLASPRPPKFRSVLPLPPPSAQSQSQSQSQSHSNTRATSFDRLFSSSGLDGAVGPSTEEEALLDGGGTGSGGRWAFSGWDGSDHSDLDNHEPYYQRMIEANPTNSLLLRQLLQLPERGKRRLEKGRAVLRESNPGESRRRRQCPLPLHGHHLANSGRCTSC